MDSRLSQRLSFRLTRNVVLSALTLGLLLNLGVVTLDYFNARSNMNSEIRALMEISHSPASQIAYNIDSRLAEELLDGLLRHPAIVQARIEDPKGRILAQRQRPASDSPYRWLSDSLFQPRRDYSEQLHVSQLADMALGHLHVTIDTYPFGSTFLERAGYTLLSGFIMSLALAGLLLVIFYMMITKPLLRVVSGLQDVDSEQAEKARLPTPWRHENDEIGLLVHITNEHLDTIDNSLQKLREAEGRLKDYNEKLAQIVETRTSEIRHKNEALQRSNKALIEAREEALETARARADFLASMSHEIRTPLNGLLGMLKLTLESRLSATQSERLKLALSAGENLVALVNDILDISKVEAGKLTLERISLDAGALAEECATLFAQQSACTADVDIVTRIAPDIEAAYLGDPTRLRQIINNLMGNAIKFTAQGQIILSLEPSDNGLQLMVADTGIGMSEEAQESVFSPFSQGQADTTRRFGGTGLGLTLCRQLVDRMGGTIDIDSREQEGTRVRVLLPLDADHDAPARDGETDFKGMRALLLAGHDTPHGPPLQDHLRYWGINVQRQTTVPRDSSVLDLDNQDLIIVNSREPEWQILLEQLQRCPPVVAMGTDGGAQRSEIIQLPLVRRQLVNTLRIIIGLTAVASDSHSNPPRATVALDILLVEDNRVNQMVASGMLRKLGHQVTIRENGEQALEYLRNHSCDLVLMDCQMPVIDGFEATRQLRGMRGLDHIPVIAVTANAMEGDREQCLNAGMNDYLTKPYSIEAMREILERWSGAAGVQLSRG